MYNFFLLAKAEAYKNEGNDEYRKKEYSNAIQIYTEGIEVNCKDDELNAQLYTNRATAHFCLGEVFSCMALEFQHAAWAPVTLCSYNA